MLYPAMSKLLSNINSRYLMVNVVARRARQISIEANQQEVHLTEKPGSFYTISIHQWYNGCLKTIFHKSSILFKRDVSCFII